MRSHRRQCRILRIVVTAAILGRSALTMADDWKQWLGNDRNSVWSEEGIVDVFPAGGLPRKWSAKIAGGYAGPSVAQNRVFLHDYLRSEGDPSPTPDKANSLKGRERVRCYDAETGKLNWSHAYDCDYAISYPAGPRVTPTVDGDRVYALGAEGHLLCLKVQDGSVLWRRDLKKDYGLEKAPYWGFCGHPLVHGDKLICLVGGEGSVAVAFEKNTGREIWRSLSAREQGYCPPMLIQAGQRPQLVIWHAESVNGLDPETGQVYWSVPMEPDYGMSIVTPVQFGDYLFVGGHQNKSLLLKLDSSKPDAEVVWRDRAFGPVHSPVLIVDGYLYGIAHKGELQCVELESGKHRWETLAVTTGDRPAGSATAFIVRHGDKYFIFSEKGDLILARLTPAGYEEVSRAHLLEPTGNGFGRKVLWSHPAFAHKCIYVRNDDVLACYELASDVVAKP